MLLFICIATLAILLERWFHRPQWKRQCAQEEIADLPEIPGVYILYNKRGKLIHVGHSGNLRRRLSQHPKRQKIKSFDWSRIRNKQLAFEEEMRLQKKLGYEGR